MTKEDLIKEVKESKKYRKILTWINLIGTSILLIILLIGIFLRW